MGKPRPLNLEGNWRVSESDPKFAMVKWEHKTLSVRLNNVAERKREELLQSIKDGVLMDPISILVAVAISTAVSVATYAVGRAFAPKQKPQRVGQLTGNIQLQNSEQGLFIPEIYGASPSFSPAAGANPVPQNSVNGTSNGSGGFTKTSGGSILWNCGMSHNVQINEGDNAFMRIIVGTGYACAGFATTASPDSGNEDFRFALQWNPPDSSITLKYANTLLLAGVSTFAPGDEFTVELRDGRFRMYKGAAEIIPQNFTFPAPTYPMWLGIGIEFLGAGMSACKVAVGADIGPPPNGGAGGVKVPAIIIWTSGLRKHETPVQQQTGGGKGHAPTETVIQVSYDLDIALMFGRGPLSLIREYANADAIFNQDPQLALASGVYDSTVGSDPTYTLDNMPDPQEGYVRPFSRLDGELEPIDPFDPTGGGLGGGFQGGGAPTNIYPGSATQLQDPTIESDIDGKYGVGSTPAYRGRAYIAHKTFKLDRWQGVVPNFTAVWEHQTLKTLSAIFASFCQREGLTNPAGDFDFSSLDSISVRGLKIDGARYSPSAVMDSPELQAMFNYFTTEGEGKLLAYENGEEPTITIPEFDFGWVDGEDEPKDVIQTISTTVDKETSRPKQVEVKYVHPGSDWDIDMQLESRRNTDGREIKTIEVNVTALSNEARAAAQRVLYQEYVAGTTYKFTLPWTYLFLYPGYRITTTLSDGFTYVFRLLSLNGGIGVLECEAVALEIETFTQPASTSNIPDYNPGQTVPTMTVAAYIDIPARIPAEIQGILVAGCPRTNVGQAYRGFTLWTKQNNQWVSLATITGVAIMGKVVSSTSLSTDPTTVDNVGQIIVDLYNNGSLSSVPEADMVAGANRAVFGELVCGFATAVQDPAFPNRWTLTKLLNGQDNTANHIGDVLAGTFFVSLDDAVKFVPLPDEAINNPLTLRAVTFGQSLIDAADVIFTWKGNSFKALAPENIFGAYDQANGNLLLDWFADFPTESDQFELEIRSAANGGGTLLRGSIPIKPLDNVRVSGTPPLKAIAGGANLTLGAYTYVEPGGFDALYNEAAGEWSVFGLHVWVESESTFDLTGGFMVECQSSEFEAINGLFPSFQGIVPIGWPTDSTNLAGWTKGVSITMEAIKPIGASNDFYYLMTKGDRFTLQIQPDGTVVYYINYLGALSDPWFISPDKMDLSKEYKLLFFNEPYPTGVGASVFRVKVRHTRWLRNLPEFVYTGEMQKADNSGSLPATVHVGVRKKSAHPLGPPSDWLYASFTR